jgi:hypothetical protein
MMLTGRIFKGDGHWLAECEAIYAYTFGDTRQEAFEMLADCVATLTDPTRVKVSVVEIGEVAPDVVEVLIDADPPDLLFARLLTSQLDRHRLTVEEVAQKLGGTGVDYEAYEQASTESLARLRALLAIVAPELALAIVPREGHSTNRPG